MATLEKIRKRGGLLVSFVIGFALLAFILGDFLKGQNHGIKGADVGEVDGTSISYQEYQNELTKAENFTKLRSGKSSIDGDTRYQIREQVWNQMVQGIVMDKKYNDLSINVTTDEILDLATGAHVHPAIRQMFTDPRTGKFNRSSVINFLKNRRNDPNMNFYWNYLEHVIVKEKLYSKYSNLITKGLYVTNEQASSEAKAKQRSVDFDFVAVNYNTIPDSTIKVSPSEISNYYDNNKEDFKQNAERSVEYVSFTVDPSSQDKQATEDWINDTKKEFAAADTDPAQFIAMNSDVPYTNKNLNLDDVKSELRDFAKTAKKGDVYGPYFEDNTYKLSRLVSTGMMADSVKARHILITQKDPKAADHIADSLMTVIRKGGDFAAIARKYSKDTGSSINGGDLNWFKEGRMVKPFNDACFNNAKKGDLIKVKSKYGVHIINIQAVGKKSMKYNIATLARTVKYSSKTYQKVYSVANKFASNNKTSDKFLAAIKKENLTPRFATFKQNEKEVSGLEGSRTLIQWAFKSSVNDMSPSIYEFGNHFVIAVITDAKDKGYADVNSSDVNNRIKRILAKNKKAEKIIAEFNKEKSSSKSITSLAQKMNSTVQTANNINFNTFQVPGAGVEPALVALATTSDVNAISTPIKGDNAVYVVKVISESNTKIVDLKTVKKQLAQEFSYKINYQLLQDLIINADVTDGRTKFF